jgi:GDSL-like Lipase/Acylhydrolase
MARLVAIGDSLTQGFHSFAITNTDQSYPAVIARAMGLDIQRDFRLPDFRGRGGLPCSIEWLSRRLEERYGANLGAFEWPRALHTVADFIDEVEDYWERGRGTLPTAEVDYHNLAVWGFEVADAYNITAKICEQAVHGSKDNWFRPPSEARLRTALNVLNPARGSERLADTQLTIAKRISERQGGIDHLIVWLGANNCLGTVVHLDIRPTGVEPPGPRSDRTLWRPEAFAMEYGRLENEIAALGARHVYVGTVPHVTIPPITRGVMHDRGRLPLDRTYFDYYTRFFIHDKDFDPGRDPHLTGKQAEEIDQTIDRYNDTIRVAADRHGWHVVDICQMLDDLAVRRNHGVPRYPLPAELSDLSVRLLEYSPGGNVKSGGLVSLDGVHPTACGYALVAQEFVRAMRPYEPGIRDVDFADARRWDTLITYPPRTLDDMLGALRALERWFHLSRWLD